MTKKSGKNYVSLLGLALGIVILFVIAKNITNIEPIILKAGLAGPLVALCLYALFAPTPVPTDSLTIICGAVYGLVYGTAIAWMGNNIAALVEYYIGRRLGKGANLDKELKRLPLGLGKLPISSIPVLTLGRMIPFYGSKIISILAGIYNVPRKRYIWTSALVNFFGAVMLAYGGDKLLDLLKNLFD